MVKKNAWTFQAHFRARAYGWKGSTLAIKRLKEAVTEIKKAARSDAVRAADGAVTLVASRLLMILLAASRTVGVGVIFFTLRIAGRNPRRTKSGQDSRRRRGDEKSLFASCFHFSNRARMFTEERGEPDR